MRRRVTILHLFATILAVAAGCIDPYRPGEVTGNVNYLVVDGFLDATQNKCTVKLSRTIPLDGTEQVFERSALVTLEDEMNESYSLTESSAGVYTVSGVSLDASKKYRIRIQTTGSETYESDFVPVLTTPAIDSITWRETEDGVGIYANTHDEANNTRYYQWRFSETWFYRSQYRSIIKIVGDTVALRDFEELKIYECWNTAPSQEILVASSEKLSQDIISQFKLSVIPFTSSKIRLKYSMLVEQRAIEPRAYEYWQLLKKNTEEMGTIFDPLPSAALGNLRAAGNTKKTVLGYFSAGTVSNQRIFIAGRDIEFPLGNIFVSGYESCSERIVLFGQGFGTLVPIVFEMKGMEPIGYRATTPYCIDCQMQGGTTVKPDFWEDLN